MKPTFKLHCEFVKRYKVKHEYVNRSDKDIELWFSLPRESQAQRNISFISLPTPAHVDRHPFLNTVHYYVVKPKEELLISYEFDGYSVSLVSDKAEDTVNLSAEERDYYLRSTPITPTSQELRLEAEHIISSTDDKIEIGRKLFHHILKSYRYSTNFAERGVPSFREKKKGDCGEFAGLFISYCRSLGIPSRMMVGAWAKGKTQAHAWCEFYVENIGWIPVDISAASMLKNPLRNISGVTTYGMYSKKKKYFGSLEGKRIAFSIDINRLLIPVYKNNKDYDNSFPLFKVGDRMLAWGQESIDGTAPYMQPMYVRLNCSMKKLENEAVLGKWKVTEPMVSQIFLSLKNISLTMGLILMLIPIIVTNFFGTFPITLWFNLISTVFFLLFVTISIFRREKNIFVIVLGVLFVFSFMGTISEIYL
ncbi:transglutaminase-like domain-containing protein [Sutcliffiella horikoshii]|uniref:transglutaminase-like domain-containing protein n=1 Tax=Sutcliffiella horikoshii TaxID=79883 RepID=UPI003CF4B16F